MFNTTYTIVVKRPVNGAGISFLETIRIFSFIKCRSRCDTVFVFINPEQSINATKWNNIYEASQIFFTYSIHPLVMVSTTFYRDQVYHCLYRANKFSYMIRRNVSTIHCLSIIVFTDNDIFICYRWTLTAPWFTYQPYVTKYYYCINPLSFIWNLFYLNLETLH